MPETLSGSLTCTEPGDRPRSLEAVLAHVVPGADNVQVTLQAPTESWPHLHARAYDAEGCLTALNHAKVHTIARWNEAYDFNPATGHLTPSAQRVGHLAAPDWER